MSRHGYREVSPPILDPVTVVSRYQTAGNSVIGISSLSPSHIREHRVSLVHSFGIGRLCKLNGRKQPGRQELLPDIDGPPLDENGGVLLCAFVFVARKELRCKEHQWRSYTHHANQQSASRVYAFGSVKRAFGLAVDMERHGPLFCCLALMAAANVQVCHSSAGPSPTIREYPATIRRR